MDAVLEVLSKQPSGRSHEDIGESSCEKGRERPQRRKGIEGLIMQIWSEAQGFLELDFYDEATSLLQPSSRNLLIGLERWLV